MFVPLLLNLLLLVCLVIIVLVAIRFFYSREPSPRSVARFARELCDEGSVNVRFSPIPFAFIGRINGVKINYVRSPRIMVLGVPCKAQADSSGVYAKGHLEKVDTDVRGDIETLIQNNERFGVSIGAVILVRYRGTFQNLKNWLVSGWGVPDSIWPTFEKGDWLIMHKVKESFVYPPEFTNVDLVRKDVEVLARIADKINQRGKERTSE